MQVAGGGSRSWAPSPSVLNLPDSEKTIPVVGRIAAGVPIESCLDQGHSPDEWLEMAPTAFGQKSDVVALLVEGESMRDAGIHSGDHAVIRRQSSVENGEIAAVTIEGEGTERFVGHLGCCDHLHAPDATRSALLAAQAKPLPREVASHLAGAEAHSDLVSLVVSCDWSSINLYVHRSWRRAPIVATVH